MKTISSQVRDLSKLEKDLRGINIAVVSRKDGTIKVKWGKKLDMIRVPSIDWGNTIKEEFEAVIKRKADMVSEAIKHIECRVEQLQMELFGKDGQYGKFEGDAVGNKAAG